MARNYFCSCRKSHKNPPTATAYVCATDRVVKSQRLVFLRRIFVHLSSGTYHEADGADVIVAPELQRRGPGQRVDLLDRLQPEQEAAPARLRPQPHVAVRVDDDDRGARPAPLAQQRLPDAVRHHAHGHRKLQHPAHRVHPVDHLVQVFHGLAAEQLRHEEGVDEQRARDLRRRERTKYQQKPHWASEAGGSGLKSGQTPEQRVK